VANLALVQDRALAAASAPGLQAVLVVNDRRRCAEANEAACELVGLSRDEIVGRRLDSLMAPAMRGRLSHVWTAFAEAGGHAGPFTLASGAEIQLQLTPNLMPDRHLLVLSPIGPAVTPSAGELAEPARVDEEAPQSGGRRPSRPIRKSQSCSTSRPPRCRRTCATRRRSSAPGRGRRPWRSSSSAA
jgi:PAS domain S-box-containing protein